MEEFDLAADRPEREPDVEYSGHPARAWRMDSARQHREAGLPPERHCAVASWLIEAPWAHPFWHSYWFVCMLLRPIAGLTTKFYLTGATHELWLWALDPKQSRREFDQTGVPPVLNPKNFSAQIIKGSDEEAAALIDATVRDICRGVLSPDTDFRSQWIERFGNNMLLERAR